MNILVFGATGKTGQHLVTRALQQGHYVTAFVHPTSQNALAPADNLEIIKGDTLTYTAVEEAMQGQETVIEVMETEAMLSAALLTDSTFNIIKAMHANRVKRLVALSVTGWGILSRAPFLYRVWLYYKQTKRNAVVQETNVHEAFVKKSGLEWTIVRTAAVKTAASNTTEADITQWPHILLRKPFVARSTLANFLLTIAVHHSYINQVVGISDK